jgi:hypothetical protein
MNRVKFLISLVLSISILMFQVGGAFAAPATQDSGPISGKVHRITLDTDPHTGVTVVIVELVGQGHAKQLVRVDEETAISLGLVALDVDGPLINKAALGMAIEIEPEDILPSQAEEHHPVANALATFFAGIGEGDALYDLIMTAHEGGAGFGVIAQALWLTSEIPGGDLEDFQALLLARQEGDYTGFELEDGSTPTNWAQLRKAIFEGKKVGNLGSILTSHENNAGGTAPANDIIRDKEKDKEQEKSDNGNGGNSEAARDKEKKK